METEISDDFRSWWLTKATPEQTLERYLAVANARARLLDKLEAREKLAREALRHYAHGTDGAQARTALAAMHGSTDPAAVALRERAEGHA